MPPARHASVRHATAAPRRQPRQPPRRRPRLIAPSARLRVRWERVGRVGLLVVLAVVVGLYVEHTLSYFSTRTQAKQQQAIVNRLAQQNAGLARETKSLNDPETIVSEARALGMVRPNERPYVIIGKPSP
jgi:cell division protein FtsB